MINNVITINHNDPGTTFHKKDPHTGEEQKHRKLELDAMRGLGYYDVKMGLIRGRKVTGETRNMHGSEKLSEEPDQNIYIPASESMEATFENKIRTTWYPQKADELYEKSENKFQTMRGLRQEPLKKVDNVSSGAKAAEGEEKGTPGINRIDIRITEDGAREKIETPGRGAKDDTAVIVELSRSARYASYKTAQTA